MICYDLELWHFEVIHKKVKSMVNIDVSEESPGGRIGHISAYYKGYMLVLGGYNGYNVS
jgi:hypothetical protein